MNLASDHSIGRATAALCGSLPLAAATSIALARLLPLDVELRFLIGFVGFFAIWPAAICLLFLASSGLRAWSTAAVLTVAAAALSVAAGSG